MSGGIPDSGDGHPLDFWNPDLGPHGFRDGQSESGLYLPDDPLPFPHEPFPPTLIIDLHKNSDVDSSSLAQHHTLGPRHNQSSPGDHSHDGKTSALLPKKLSTSQIIQKTAECTVLVTLSSATEVDVTGAAFTFTTTAFAATCDVSVTFDFQCNTASAGNIAIGFLNVDGTDQNRQALFDMQTVNARDTVAQHYQFTVAAGVHTFKLRAALLVAGGSTDINTMHTNISMTCFDM